MVIAIVGPGGLGQALALVTARAGHQVWLLGKPERIDALTRSGIRLSGQEESTMAILTGPGHPGPGKIQGADRMPPGTPVDLAIFTTKAHHLKDAMGRLRGSTPQAILGVQNGMAKDDLLWSVFGRNHVVGASTTTGADRQPDGTVLVTQRGNTYVGLLNRESPLAPQQERLLQELANSLTQQGYPTEVRTNIRAVEWSKVCNAGSTFGITVLTRVPVSDIWTRRPLVHAFLQLVREIATIAQETEGILVEDVPGLPILSYVSLSAEEVWERFGRKTPRPSHSPGHYPSMLQDLLAGRSLEVDEVFGDLVRRAAQRDIPVPHLDFVYHLITGLNA